MNFAEPNWLYALLALPLIVVVAALRRASRRRAIESIISKRVADSVFPGNRRTLWIRTALRMLGVVGIAVALARPQEGTTLVKEVTKSHDIFIAIDVSKSMLTRDISPSRLQQARIIALDLIEQFSSDRFGVVSFAGSATVSAPLTLDHSAVRETIEQLDTSNIPVGGSELASPIRSATKTASEKSLGGALVIMLTDGEETSEEVFDAESVADAIEQNVQLLVVGIGTDQGDLIPDPENANRPVRDRQGNNVISRLNREGITNLANQLQSKALFTTSSRAIAAAVRDSLSSLETRQTEREEQAQATVHFEWPLTIGLIAIGLSLLPSLTSRKMSAAASVALMIIALPTPTHAAPSPPLRAADFIEQGDVAMRDNAYPEALENYQKALESREPLLSSTKRRIAEAAAIAAYKEQKFTESTEYFGQVLGIGNSQQKAVREYNFANALAMSAEQALATQEQPTSEATGIAIKTLETAVTHYDEALRHQPTFPNADSNRQKVLDRIEELKQQQEQQQQEEEKEQEQKDQQEQQDDQEKDPQSGDQQNEDQQGKQNQEQDGQQNDQETSSEGEQKNQEGEEESPEEGEGSEQEGEPNNQGEPQNRSDGNEQQDAQEGQGSGEIGDASSQSGESVDAASVTAAQLAEMNPEEREKTLSEIRELLRSRAKESKDAPLKQPVQPRRVEKNW